MEGDLRLAARVQRGLRQHRTQGTLSIDGRGEGRVVDADQERARRGYCGSS
jgi:hypothetical protein